LRPRAYPLGVGRWCGLRADVARCAPLATRSVAVSRSSLACMDGCSPCAVVARFLSWVPVRSRLDIRSL
jgi:hypothetical protein